MADGHPSAIPHHVIDRASEKEDFILLLTRSSPQVEIVIFTADRNHSTTPTITGWDLYYYLSYDGIGWVSEWLGGVGYEIENRLRAV